MFFLSQGLAAVSLQSETRAPCPSQLSTGTSTRWGRGSGILRSVLNRRSIIRFGSESDLLHQGAVKIFKFQTVAAKDELLPLLEHWLHNGLLDNEEQAGDNDYFEKTLTWYPVQQTGHCYVRYRFLLFFFPASTQWQDSTSRGGQTDEGAHQVSQAA